MKLKYFSLFFLISVSSQVYAIKEGEVLTAGPEKIKFNQRTGSYTNMTSESPQEILKQNKINKIKALLELAPQEKEKKNLAKSGK